MAAVSVLIGVLNWLQAHDPNYTQDGNTKLSGAAVLGLRDIWREMKVVMSIPTFLLIIVQVTSHELPCCGKTYQNLPFLALSFNAVVFLTYTCIGLGTMSPSAYVLDVAPEPSDQCILGKVCMLSWVSAHSVHAVNSVFSLCILQVL